MEQSDHDFRQIERDRDINVPEPDEPWEAPMMSTYDHEEEDDDDA